jgi:hypothetical protein
MIVSLFHSIPEAGNTSLEVNDTGLEVSGASLHVINTNGHVQQSMYLE